MDKNIEVAIQAIDRDNPPLLLIVRVNVNSSADDITRIRRSLSMAFQEQGVNIPAIVAGRDISFEALYRSPPKTDAAIEPVPAVPSVTFREFI